MGSSNNSGDDFSLHLDEHSGPSFDLGHSHSHDKFLQLDSNANSPTPPPHHLPHDTLTAHATLPEEHRLETTETPTHGKYYLHDHLDPSSFSIQTRTPSGRTRIRKRKLPRDPNAPVHFTSSFQLFWKEKAEYMNQLNQQSKLTLMDRNLIVKKFYDELPEQERQRYRDIANRDRQRYLKEMEQYKKTSEYAAYCAKVQSIINYQPLSIEETSPSASLSAARAGSFHSMPFPPMSERKRKRAGAGQPQEPKALTAFFLFCNEMRPKITVEQEMAAGDTKLLAQTRILTKMWNELDEMAKEKYRALYRRHREEIKAYHAAKKTTRSDRAVNAGIDSHDQALHERRHEHSSGTHSSDIMHLFANVHYDDEEEEKENEQGEEEEEDNGNEHVDEDESNVRSSPLAHHDVEEEAEDDIVEDDLLNYTHAE